MALPAAAGVVLLATPVTAAAVVVAEQATPLSGPEYGLLGTVIVSVLAGVAWWAKDVRRREESRSAETLKREDAMRAEALQREDAQRAEALAREESLRGEIAGLHLRIDAMQDRMTGDIVPLASRMTEAAARMMAMLDARLIDSERRERG